jgi:hypothetical protein
MSNELVTMHSLADAKEMVAILRNHPDDDFLRATFVNSTTTTAWPFLVAAKYPEWIVEKAETWKENELLAVRLYFTFSNTPLIFPAPLEWSSRMVPNSK